MPILCHVFALITILHAGSHFANDEEGSKISQLLAFNDVDDEAEAQSTGAGVPMLGVSRKVSSKRKRARRK